MSAPSCRPYVDNPFALLAMAVCTVLEYLRPALARAEATEGIAGLTSSAA